MPGERKNMPTSITPSKKKNITPSITIFLIFLGLFRLDSFPGLEAATGTLASVPGLYVFGDSLVDAGNNNHLEFSISKANYPHNGVDFPGSIATGRFCNGKNAADAIAEKFGLPLPPPFLSLLPPPFLPLKGTFKEEERKAAALTGVNFASGGAGIFNASDQQLRQSIPLSYQVNNWFAIHKELTSQLDPSEAQIHLSKSLFFVVIGSNDIFDNFGTFKLRQKTNSQQYTQSMADKLKEQLKRLYDTGARRFLIIGVAQIGCAPAQRAKNLMRECDEEVNFWGSLYNKALVKMLQELKEELGSSMTYSYFDNFKSLHDIITNPARYGFADVKSACCGNGILNAEIPCLPIARYCSDRTKYLFWDLFGHPTEAAARTIVDLMLSDDSQYSHPLTLTQLVSS